MKERIEVTKPFLPPIDEITPYLNEIWNTSQITNGGKFSKEFEDKLCEYLGVEYVSLFSSGTLALTLALKSLNLTGEVITTAFTHISTIQAIYWNNLIPVFVDIDKLTLNLSTTEIEKAIGPNTCAIMPVHVFGNPCNVKEIERISSKYNLKVIYDAAHSFGVKIFGQSVLNYGDLSVLSLHATKVFNTIEGGVVVSRSRTMKDYLDALSNSGIDKNNQLKGYGLNAKMNEIQAVYGIVSLNYVDKLIENRKRASNLYRLLFKKIDRIKLIDISEDIDYNYIYFPIIINEEIFGSSINKIMAFLESKNVYARRYFYPLVTENSFFRHYKKFELNVSTNISENILCLPLSHEINSDEISYIVNLFNEI